MPKTPQHQQKEEGRKRPSKPTPDDKKVKTVDGEDVLDSDGNPILTNTDDE